MKTLEVFLEHAWTFKAILLHVTGMFECACVRMNVSAYKYEYVCIAMAHTFWVDLSSRNSTEYGVF